VSSILRFTGVSKSYAGLPVLSGVSFEIFERDVVGIFGQSGAGKTTLLRLASGLLEPSSGEIVNTAARIGYVFQEPRVLPWKTALENVAIPLMALGMDGRRARKKARDWLAKMGLQGFEDYFPARLSGGMVQRVSLARAFAVEPDMLILDEPFGALDIQLKDTMFALLKEHLEARPATVLYVSHVPEDVIRIATRIFILDSGGTLKEVPVMEGNDLVRVLREKF